MLLALLTAPSPSAFADGLKLDQITASLLKGIQDTGKKRVAVFDFTDLDGNTSLLGKYVAEELSVELTQSGNGIEVVDRAHLSAILREHKMSEQGLTDPTTAKQLGQFTGADVIVTGSLTNVGDAVLIVAKALSTDSARIIAASSGTLPMSSEISTLLRNASSPSREGDRSTPTPEGLPGNAQSQEANHNQDSKGLSPKTAEQEIAPTSGDEGYLFMRMKPCWYAFAGEIHCTGYMVNPEPNRPMAIALHDSSGTMSGPNDTGTRFQVWLFGGSIAYEGGGGNVTRLLPGVKYGFVIRFKTASRIQVVNFTLSYADDNGRYHQADFVNIPVRSN